MLVSRSRASRLLAVIPPWHARWCVPSRSQSATGSTVWPPDLLTTITSMRQTLLHKLIVPQLLKRFSAFYYCVHNMLSDLSHFNEFYPVSWKIHFIILPSISVSSKCLFPLGFPPLSLHTLVFPLILHVQLIHTSSSGSPQQHLVNSTDTDCPHNFYTVLSLPPSQTQIPFTNCWAMMTHETGLAVWKLWKLGTFRRNFAVFFRAEAMNNVWCCLSVGPAVIYPE